MLGVDRWLQRRRRIVIGLWVVAVLAALPLAAAQTSVLTGGIYDAPGSQSEAVESALARGDFPRGAKAQMAVLLTPGRRATPADTRRAIGRVDQAARAAEDVVLTPRARGRALARAERTPPGRPLVVPLRLAVGEDAAIDVAKDLRKQLDLGEATAGNRIGPVDVHLIGQGALWAAVQEAQKKDVAEAEVIGFPLIAIILLAVFGSIAAALLPLALGFAAVAVTGAIVFGLAHLTPISVFTTNMASMIGIGVAVDYSLFVLSRYREEIAAGRSPDEARGVAVATSGLAVLFSGLTVVASLLGLFLLDDQTLRSMALGAIVVVALAVLASCTLLPLLLTVLGRRAYAPGRIGRWKERRRARRARRAPDRPGFWHRWTGLVMRRPAIAAALSAALLLAMALPALDMKVANRATSLLPERHEARDGLAALVAVRGVGAGSPIKVVVEPADPGTVERVRTILAREPVVRSVRSPIYERGRDRALLLAPMRVSSDSDAGADGVLRLRERLAEVRSAARADVGGNAAEQYDYDEFMLGSMWKLLLFVLGLSFLVLLVLLRSIVLPLKAVVMNLLAVAAAYGVLVGVFQWGWLEWAGVERTGHIQTFIPPLILAVMFGLSMDYEVFLLSRIRERWLRTGDTRRAVAEGLASSAGTITSAAIIMIAVFLTFMQTGVAGVRQIGLGNAVAIALDATLVRLVLVPAAMSLVGRWNWWLPPFLARVLPESSAEELRVALPGGAHVDAQAPVTGRIRRDSEPEPEPEPEGEPVA